MFDHYKDIHIPIEVQNTDTSVTDDGLGDNNSIASTIAYFMESDEAGVDLLQNLLLVIDNNLMPKGNILFLLFPELLRYLVRPCLFMYNPMTLLWWLSRQKQFSNKWIRMCKGFKKKM